MSEPIYIAGKNAGPLVKTCQQVFCWTEASGLIVVIWHGAWKDDKKFWETLASTMSKATKGSHTLIAFFGNSIDEMREKDGGDRLPLLLRLLGRDNASRSGCCSITDFRQLGKAPIPFDPEAPETALILKSNKIMGLCFNETNKA